MNKVFKLLMKYSPRLEQKSLVDMNTYVRFCSECGEQYSKIETVNTGKYNPTYGFPYVLVTYACLKHPHQRTILTNKIYDLS